MANPEDIKKSIMNPDADVSNPVDAVDKQSEAAGLPPAVKDDKQADKLAEGSSWLDQTFPEDVAGKYKTAREVEKAIKEKDSAYSKRDEHAKKLEGFFEIIGAQQGGDYNTGLDIAQNAVSLYHQLNTDPVGFFKNNPELLSSVKQAMGGSVGGDLPDEELTDALLDPAKAPTAVRKIIAPEIERISKENKELKSILLNFVTTQNLSEQEESFADYKEEYSKQMAMGRKPQDALDIAKGKILGAKINDIKKAEFEKGKAYAVANYDPATGKVIDKPLEAATTPESAAQQLQQQAENIKQAIFDSEGGDDYAELDKALNK